MQSVIKVTSCQNAFLSVPWTQQQHCAVEIEVVDAIEREIPFTDIAFVLGFIVDDSHRPSVTRMEKA